MSSETLFEISIGVYTAAKDLVRLTADFSRRLDERGLPYQLSVADGAESYALLPEQWRIENPGADPGTREVHELRVGVYATREEMDAIREELTRVVCPDPEHDSPCPVPWSARWSEDGLDGRYGHLVA